MRTLIRWFVATVVDALGSLEPQKKAPEEPLPARSEVDKFLQDTLPHVLRRDTQIQPRSEERRVRRWLIATDRTVLRKAPRGEGADPIHIENEIEQHERTGLWGCVEAYFKNTRSDPATTCLIYGVQDRAHVEQLQEIRKMYPDLTIIVVMVSTDPENVAQIRNLHTSWTSLAALVVLPHMTCDTQSFLDEIVSHLPY